MLILVVGFYSKLIEAAQLQINSESAMFLQLLDQTKGSDRIVWFNLDARCQQNPLSYLLGTHSLVSAYLQKTTVKNGRLIALLQNHALDE